MTNTVQSRNRMMLTIIASMSIYACGAGHPTIDQAKEAVKPKIAHYGELLDFRKVNGEALVESGQKRYVLHFRAAARLDNSWDWVAGNAFESASIEKAQKAGGPYYFSLRKRTKIPENSTYVAKGTVAFRFTEQGWAVDEATVTEYGYCNPGSTPPECLISSFGAAPSS